MKAMYEVIDNNVLTKLNNEVARKQNFMNNTLVEAKELLPEVETLAFVNDGLRGGIRILGLVFNKDHEVDNKLFKKVNTMDYRTIYRPKLNSKKGKELNKDLSFLGKTEKFFNGFEEDLSYNPENNEEFRGGCLYINSLRFGYALKDDKCRFVFGGYEGYVPPKGVAEEMLTSEYNSLFGK